MTHGEILAGFALGCPYFVHEVFAADALFLLAWLVPIAVDLAWRLGEIGARE